MGEQALRIRQWQAEYRLPRRDPLMGRRLDDLLRRQLSAALQSSLAPHLASEDGILLLRAVRFDMDLDMSLPDGQILRCLAAGFTRALARAATGLGDDQGSEVVYFPGRSAYLARFLVDLAAGRAWGAWYYREFEGLKALPAAMAIRTAVLNDPGKGQAALLQLDNAELARLLTALTDAEARRIVSVLARQPGAPTTVSDGQVERLIAAAAQEAVFGQTGGKAVLALYLGVTSTPESVGGPPLERLCTAVVHWLSLWERSRRPRALADAVIQGRLAPLDGLAGAPATVDLQPLLKLPAGRRRQLVGILTRPRASGIDRQRRFTPFGGAFMLLPLLREMPLEAALDPWPQPEGADKRAVVRLLLLAQALGGQQAAKVFRDPLLRDLAGVGPGFTGAHARQWLDRITTAQLNHSRRQLAAWGLSRKDEADVNVTHLAFAGRHLAIAQSAGGRLWLFLRGCRPTRMQSFMKALRSILPEETEVKLSAAGDQPGLAGDLAFLGLAADLRPGHAAHDLLCCAAQMLLRDFSARLPGFAGSSPAYLFRNFLAVGAGLQTEDHRHVVQLDSAPLNVILAMTGLSRARYRLPWWDPRPVALYPEG